MSESADKSCDRQILSEKAFPILFKALSEAGYKIIGPVVRDRTVVLDEITEASSLPSGWTDTQDAGEYRLAQTDSPNAFDFATSLHTWKRFLFPPTHILSRIKRTKAGFEVEPTAPGLPKLAFVGVRPCDLAALRIQDQIFTQGEHVDPFYDGQRKHLFIVAVNCTRPGGTCFCRSMGTGPEVTSGYDIALTEQHQDNLHYFVVRSGSEKGADLLDKLTPEAASEHQIALEQQSLAEAAAHMGREIVTDGVKELLYRNVDSRHWDQVGGRCLTCGNCTMVCPTCFCSTIEDFTDLSGSTAERIRRWDSCFTMEYSYIHGGSVRPSARARYRQWLTHKFASWIDQFGTSGCVGCGRCITWCPVGIDVTEELQAIRETDTGQSKVSEHMEAPHANT